MELYLALLILLGILVFLIIVVLTSRTRIFLVYSKYNKIDNSINHTGRSFAVITKRNLGLSELTFAIRKEQLSDAYNPKTKMIILSEDVADNHSLSSIAIVSHEFGHAIQDRDGNPQIKLEHALTSLTKLTNKLIIPLAIISLILKVTNVRLDIAEILTITTIVLLGLQIIKKLLSIPIEYGASKIALNYLKDYKLVTKKELPKIKKLLNTAAQTYIASLLDGILFFKK